MFGLPRNDKERRVPLPPGAGAAVRVHLEDVGAHPVSLPWEDPVHGRECTVPLVFTTQRRSAVRQQVAANQIWHPALKAAGMHALRHFYASALLDAGENVKAVSEWLGHADPAFTLRVYAHLMPDSPRRARRTLDALLGGDDGPGTAQNRG